MSVNRPNAGGVDPNLAPLNPKFLTPANSPDDLHNEAHELLLGIVNVSQNPIRKSCFAEMFICPSPRNVPMIAAVRQNAIYTPVLPLPRVQQTDHALLVFGHTYGVCPPHLYLRWGVPKAATD